VAGETEQMPPVMHEFVHIHAADERSGALLGSDEIDRQQKKKAGEDCQGRTSRTGMAPGSAGAKAVNVASVIGILLGLRVPLELQRNYEEGLALGPYGSNTVARPRRIPTGFLLQETRPHDRERHLILSNAVGGRLELAAPNTFLAMMGPLKL
jgi:hypothetical protein